MKNDYEINGDIITVYLQVQNGVRLTTLVDPDDLEKISVFPNRWYYDGRYVTGKQMVNKKVYTYLLHRVVMNEPPAGMRVDHIFHNTKDNRKSKLRVITNSENMQNINGNYSTNTSGYRGVYWEADRKKWRVRLKVNGNRVTVGRYDTYEEALKEAKDYVSKHMPYSKEASSS